MALTPVRFTISARFDEKAINAVSELDDVFVIAPADELAELLSLTGDSSDRETGGQTRAELWRIAKDVIESRNQQTVARDYTVDAEGNVIDSISRPGSPIWLPPKKAASFSVRLKSRLKNGAQYDYIDQHIAFDGTDVVAQWYVSVELL